MMAADCRLQKSEADADLIVEARVGTLGSDSNEVVYGMPASNALSSAASLVPNAPVIPQIPEISVARKEAQYGAAKLALFAYDRETRRPYWQSGISRAKSTSQDFWVFGAGPFQRGTIVDGVQFAGSKLGLPSLNEDDGNDVEPIVTYDRPYRFLPPVVPAAPPDVQTAGFSREASHSRPAGDAATQEPAMVPVTVSDQSPSVPSSATDSASAPKPDPEPATEPPAPAAEPAPPPPAEPAPPEVPPEEKPGSKSAPAK
jgi:hypothetical protein